MNNEIAKKVISQSSEWTFEGDCIMLQWMEQVSQNLTSRASKTKESLEVLSKNINRTHIALENTQNKFTALQYTQYMEMRCQDDEAPIETEEIEQSPIEIKTSDQILKEFLQNNLKLLHNCHDKFTFVEDSDQDDNDDTEEDCVYQPKNPYNERLLPHIFGTKMWKDNWHVGLCHDDTMDYSGDESSDKYSISSTSSDANISTQSHNSTNLSQWTSSISLTNENGKNVPKNYLPPQNTSEIKVTASLFEEPSSSNFNISAQRKSSIPNISINITEQVLNVPTHTEISVNNNLEEVNTIDTVKRRVLQNKALNLFDDDDYKSLISEIIDKSQAKADLEKVKKSQQPIPTPRKQISTVNLFDSRENSPVKEITATSDNNYQQSITVTKTGTDFKKKNVTPILFENITPPDDVMPPTQQSLIHSKTYNLFEDSENEEERNNISNPQIIPQHSLKSTSANQKNNVHSLFKNTTTPNKVVPLIEESHNERGTPRTYNLFEDLEDEDINSSLEIKSKATIKTKISAKSLFDDDDDDDFLNIFGKKKNNVKSSLNSSISNLEKRSLFLEDNDEDLNIKKAKNTDSDKKISKFPAPNHFIQEELTPSKENTQHIADKENLEAKETESERNFVNKKDILTQQKRNDSILPSKPPIFPHDGDEDSLFFNDLKNTKKISELRGNKREALLDDKNKLDIGMAKDEKTYIAEEKDQPIADENIFEVKSVENGQGVINENIFPIKTPISSEDDNKNENSLSFTSLKSTKISITKDNSKLLKKEEKELLEKDEYQQYFIDENKLNVEKEEDKPNFSNKKAISTHQEKVKNIIQTKCSIFPKDDDENENSLFFSALKTKSSETNKEVNKNSKLTTKDVSILEDFPDYLAPKPPKNIEVLIDKAQVSNEKNINKESKNIGVSVHNIRNEVSKLIDTEKIFVKRNSADSKNNSEDIKSSDSLIEGNKKDYLNNNVHKLKSSDHEKQFLHGDTTAIVSEVIDKKDIKKNLVNILNDENECTIINPVKSDNKIKIIKDKSNEEPISINKEVSILDDKYILKVENTLQGIFKDEIDENQSSKNHGNTSNPENKAIPKFDNFSPLFLDEPPDDDFFQAISYNTPGTLNLENDIFDPPITKEKPLSLNKNEETKSSSCDYNIGLFSDLPPDDDDNDDNDNHNPYTSTKPIPALNQPIVYNEVLISKLESNTDDIDVKKLDISKDSAKQLKFPEDIQTLEKNHASTSIIQSEANVTVSKLKMPKIDINVKALLPSASGTIPKFHVEKYENKSEINDSVDTNSNAQYLSKKEEILNKEILPEEHLKEQRTNLLPNLNKNRVKVQVKRKSSTRAGRQESYRRSLLDDQEPVQKYKTHIEQDKTIIVPPKAATISGMEPMSSDVLFAKMKVKTSTSNIEMQREPLSTQKIHSKTDSLSINTSCPENSIKQLRIDSGSGVENFKISIENKREVNNGLMPSVDVIASKLPSNKEMISKPNPSFDVVSKVNMQNRDKPLTSNKLFEESEDEDDFFTNLTLPKATVSIEKDLNKKDTIINISTSISHKNLSSQGKDLVKEDVEQNISDSDDDLFGTAKKTTAPTSIQQPTISIQTKTVPAKKVTSLFASDDDTDDDLFKSPRKLKEQSKPNKALAKQSTKLVSQVKENKTKSLFSDSDDDDDLFKSSVPMKKSSDVSTKLNVSNASKNLIPKSTSGNSDNPLADLLEDS